MSGANNDPRRLRPDQNKKGVSEPLFQGAGVKNQDIAAKVGFEELAKTAPNDIARSLHNKHQRSTLERVNQQDLAFERTIPVVLHFSKNKPGEALVAGNSFAMGTESLSKEGERTEHDLRNSVVYSVKMDATNLSSDRSVGLKLNFAPGTMFPNSKDHPDAKSGYNFVLLPNETVKGVPLHTSQETKNHAQLARRMIATLGANKIDLDNDVTLNQNARTGTSYVAVNPDSNLAAKIRGMEFHPKKNPKGTIITNRPEMKEKFPDKLFVDTNGRTKEILLDVGDMEKIQEMLGARAPTKEEELEDAKSGWMDLSKLKITASNAGPVNDGAASSSSYDSSADEQHAVHARITVRYTPIGAAAEHAGKEIADQIKSKIARSSANK